MLTVESIKTSLRIDHSMDDEMIQDYLETAKHYIIHAVDSTLSDANFDTYTQFKLAVSLLVQHWYLNRQDAKSERIPYTVQSLIQQLRGLIYANHQEH